MNVHVQNPALRLAEAWQRDFPLTPRPFAELGRYDDLTEMETLSFLQELQAEGILGRIGAAVRPNTVGASTLAALASPTNRLNSVAAQVSAEPCVNHNYQREHAYNLWFVAQAIDRAELGRTLDRISRTTGCPVLNLPLERAYHIDLGFRLSGPKRRARMPDSSTDVYYEPSAADHALIVELTEGLPLVPRPYLELARRMGCSEADVTSKLSALLQAGIISRFGCIFRHRRLGFKANAMAVWDVPDHDVDRMAARLAKVDAVTLCYRRKRSRPSWPYNLFAMIHGKERDVVRSQIGAAELATGLYVCAGDILFSTRCFKQCGARYGLGLRGAT